MSPLLIWSWKTPLVEMWKRSDRIRALALGHALAEAAGYRVAYYADEKERAYLSDVAWPWEIRNLPEHDDFGWFWSASKLVALDHANAFEGEDTLLLHVDTDALVKGELADNKRPLYADHEEKILEIQRIFYPVDKLREAFGKSLPGWFDAWAARDCVSVCALVGGSSRVAVQQYIHEVFHVARLLHESGMARREFTWFCEQAVHHAFAESYYGGSGYALDSNCKGKNFAHWPGGAKRHLPTYVAERWHLIPESLRRSLDSKLGPVGLSL